MSHHFGRIPSPPDKRDFRAENFLGATAGPDVATAYAEIKQTNVSYPRWAATKYTDVTATHWWKALNALGVLTPTPPPTPTGDKVWADPEAVLDQGQYGTCVGNGCAQWGNTLPVDDKYTEKDARAIYYEATVIDGSPDDPDAPGGGQQGATVRSGMKALKARGRLGAYASVDTAELVSAWLQAKGPVVCGSDWTTDMFSPNSKGFVKPTGQVAGGHCWLVRGDLPGEGAFLCRNSWGAGWGLSGDFKLAYADFSRLLEGIAQTGEAWTAVEL